MEIGKKYEQNVVRLRTLSDLNMAEISRSSENKCDCYLCRSNRFDDFICLEIPFNGIVSERYFMHEGCFLSLLSNESFRLN